MAKVKTQPAPVMKPTAKPAKGAKSMTVKGKGSKSC